MAYESKKKKRKTWFDPSTVEMQAGIEQNTIKCSGGLMGGWPEAWKNLCPPSMSKWQDVLDGFKDWKYGKVYQGS